ncbi:UNVERIFIED_ORG: hypothetical protein QOE_1780 [Clostridioides difficile F501]
MRHRSSILFLGMKYGNQYIRACADACATHRTRPHTFRVNPGGTGWFHPEGGF